MEKRRSLGVGNLVIAVYGVFALAATARGLLQITKKFNEAPVAYSLSLLAGLVYIFATIFLATSKLRLARLTIWFELVVVILVGTFSLVDSNLFPDETVWSYYGIQYGLIPLFLPIFGLWWLRRVKK